jgi:hypothetical protein
MDAPQHGLSGNARLIVARASASALSRRQRKALHVRDFGPDEWRGHWAL